MLTRKLDNFTYWRAGLPVAMRNWRLRGTMPIDLLRHQYARAFWASADGTSRRYRWRAILLAVPRFVTDAVEFTRLNGRIVARRYGRSVKRQMYDQLLVYARFGILPKWYYIFSLYEGDAIKSAPTFLNRFETKTGLFRHLNRAGKSTMGDKLEFAAWCAANDLAHVPIIASAAGGEVSIGADQLPPADLFVKPTRGRGGSGAQRWEWKPDRLCYASGEQALTAEKLLEMLAAGSAEQPCLIQPRILNHPSLADLSNGALTTVRVLTCLDEDLEPELIAASFRMAIGKNTIVDNIHAGGIAAAVDLKTGRLGKASNLGWDASLGWLSNHPDTDARIEGRILPCWDQVTELVARAHGACPGFTVVGWDIAITGDGPVLIEGNGGPDVDLIQRPARRGLAHGRFGELLAFHSASWPTP